LRSRRVVLATAIASTVAAIAAIAPAEMASASPSGQNSAAATGDAHLQPSFDLPRKVGEYHIPLRLTDKKGHVVKFDGGGYPTGCGLSVILYRTGNTISGSMATSCNFSVTSIDHNMYLYRSRFFGWERLITHEGDYSYGTNSKGTVIRYNCSGTGTHDFRVEGYGYVGMNGTTFDASAYDEIDSVSC